MINGKSVLAVIPARGGSKRVPRKNLREYRGKPLLLWAMLSAKDSKYIDMLLVSSDDEEILSIAAQQPQSGGCLWRPAELATDSASSEDVLLHALGLNPHDWAVLLQPTSPNRTAEDIDGCIETAQMGDGCISTLHGKPNGAVYVATAEWIADHNFSDPGLFKYGMDASGSFDIDNEEDFLK